MTLNILSRTKLNSHVSRAAALVVGAALLASCASTGGSPMSGKSAAKQKFAQSEIVVDGAKVTVGNARFTVLTPQLIRMEWSPTVTFEDRPSLTFIHRDLPTTTDEAGNTFVHSTSDVQKLDVRATYDGEWIQIQTGPLVLRYQDGSGAFNPDNLEVAFAVDGEKQFWRPGMKNPGNLGGTIRTLDSVNGSVPLERGILSRDGWALIDDSRRVLFTDDTLTAAEQRPGGGAQDLYFFGHGHDYLKALSDYTAVAGEIPLPPPYAFGSWWSRYWSYSDVDFMDLLQEFRRNDVPLDVLVIDMGWHLDGWTGYTWNKELFPDVPGFLNWTNDEGLRVTLNLHPADGVAKHEDQFPAMCEAMGLDPATTDRVPFDCTDSKYMKAYFDILHHPYEDMGVDFWWIDWQQGTQSKIPGLDPLFWLNHAHTQDMAMRGKRPMILSRWAGLGGHRYPLGFSGDVYSSWNSLAFQPPMTATAGNVGFGYWSHDIGGFQPGEVPPEMYARWIQWGAFSPILRTHSSSNTNAERRIWKFPKEVFNSARSFFHLRDELRPYIYSAAAQTSKNALPICRPLYYFWPELDEAYAHTDEYMFGDHFLVAPVALPMNPATKLTTVRLWLPPGTWTNWFTGETFDGPANITQLVPLDEMPLFVRAGAVIPMRPRGTVEDLLGDQIVYNVFPGANGSGWVYEDDGESLGYQKGDFFITNIQATHTDHATMIKITPGGEDCGASGNWTPVNSRAATVVLHDVWPPTGVTYDGEPLDPGIANGTSPGWWYDAKDFCVKMRLPKRLIGDTQTVVVEYADGRGDESLLREGLRGRMQLIDAYAKANQPTIAENVSQLLDQRKNDPASLAETLPTQWEAIVRVASMDECAGLDDNYTIGLLGLIDDLEVEGIDEPAGAIKVTSTLQALGPVGDLEVSKGNSIFPGWEILGDPEGIPELTIDLDSIPHDKPHVTELTLVASDYPQSSVIAGDTVFSSKGVHFHSFYSRPLLPSINAWWIIGPFDNPWDYGLDHVYPPEEILDYSASYPGKDDRTVSWQKTVRLPKPGMDLEAENFIELNDLFGGWVEYGVAYAVTYIEAREEMDAVLAVGADDGVAVWLNGEQVHNNHVGRAYTSMEDRVPLRLKQGKNTLMLKISQGQASWGFCAHLLEPDGSRLGGVTTTLEP